MTIQLIMDNVEIPVKFVRFSDGGSNAQILVPEALNPSAYFSLSVNRETPADNYLWEILLALNAIHAQFKTFKKSILNLPYLPHARADRRFETGNSLPIEVFIEAVIPYFDEIHLTDPHSDFYKKYNHIDFIVKPQEQCFIEIVKEIKSDCVLVSPDKGALNKIYKLQNMLLIRGISSVVIEADKTRDISTGRVIGTSIPNIDLSGKSVYIVDDLLDAGGTFIPLAEKLKEAGAQEVSLYVTHGIFAKGLDVFKGKIDKLHVYQTIGTYVTAGDILNFNSGKETK